MKIWQLNKQSGTTLMELLVAIAIIAIMTGIFISQIRISDQEQLETITERVAADLRQLRNLSASRVIGENNQYPVGGYGIAFQDYNGIDTPSYYILFADDGQNIGYDPTEDDLIAKYTFPVTDITVYPANSSNVDQFFYTFITEHTSTTSVPYTGDGFLVTIDDVLNSYKGEIKISDSASDGYIWGNVAVNYLDY